MDRSFVNASVQEFIQTWTSGRPGSLFLECINGEAWVQVGFRLSLNAGNHGFQNNSKCQRKSPSKQKRDKEHSVAFKQSKINAPRSSCNTAKEDVKLVDDVLENVIMDDEGTRKTQVSLLKESPNDLSKTRPICTFQKVSEVDIAPMNSSCANLTRETQCTISIPPKPVYHPAIINACKAMHDKHPDELNKEEVEKFNFYIRHKMNTGDPIEHNVIYLPMGGLRNCMQCGNLT